ncbi:MAG: dapB [Gammaproteobacteria bacterium]|jgi:4-hydroxy-tetrahydrodipicolinate reductase|nr:dapB [Gammaproteobacteria bacterium]
MTVKIIINGAAGRMGQLACAVVSEIPGFTLVAKCGRQDDLVKKIQVLEAQVVLDVTSADCVYQNAEKILQAGARPIIGTSGLNEGQVDQLKKIAAERNLGGIIAPNFSLGAILMMRFAKEAAKYFPKAEIIEMHHEQKKDAPSGTAIRTQEMMQINAPIHSVRLPGLIARQQVIFGGVGETLTLDHNTLNREAFAAGIRLACERIMHVDQLIYGLDQLLENK